MTGSHPANAGSTHVTRLHQTSEPQQRDRHRGPRLAGRERLNRCFSRSRTGHRYRPALEGGSPEGRLSMRGGPRAGVEGMAVVELVQVGARYRATDVQEGDRGSRGSRHSPGPAGFDPRAVRRSDRRPAGLSTAQGEAEAHWPRPAFHSSRTAGRAPDWRSSEKRTPRFSSDAMPGWCAGWTKSAASCGPTSRACLSSRAPRVGQIVLPACWLVAPPSNTTILPGFRSRLFAPNERPPPENADWRRLCRASSASPVLPRRSEEACPETASTFRTCLPRAMTGLPGCWLHCARSRSAKSPATIHRPR